MQQWDALRQPISLAVIAEELKAQGVPHRSVIGSTTLKAFLKKNEAAAGFRVVQNPKHHALVGVVPASVEFEYPDTVTSAQPHLPPAQATRPSTVPIKAPSTRAPLTLKKVETSSVKQSFSHGRTKAVVVEKKRALGLSTDSIELL